jgi:hypothetical protein
MFKAYGDKRYMCLPFVIGMDSPNDSQQAFDKLEKYLCLTEPPQLPTLIDCNKDGLTLDNMMDMAEYSYNACINRLSDTYGSSTKVHSIVVYFVFSSSIRMVKSMTLLQVCQETGAMSRESEVSEEENEIKRTKDVLHALYQRSKVGERETKISGLRTPVFAYLNKDKESVASALILGLITNLNTIQEAVRKGKIFKAFSQDERRTLAGFTYKIGQCAVKASKYHGADEQATLNSLFSFLTAYQPNQADKELDDVVGGYSAEDYWSDASIMVDVLRERITSFTDIMATVPVVGPTIM